MKTITEADIWQWLEAVKDPEIPTLSLVDMGVITSVTLEENGQVHVEMTPTFTGCPAIEVMRMEVEQTLKAHGMEQIQVRVSFDTIWTSDRLTEKGRASLLKFGLAPPPVHEQIFDIEILSHVPCPNCGSTDTVLRSPFGPTLCRSLHFCHSCRQGFEQFKPL